MNRTRGNPYVQPYGYLINWFSKLRLEDEDTVPEIGDTQFALDRPQRSMLPRHAGDVRLVNLLKKRLVVHRTSE